MTTETKRSNSKRAGTAAAPGLDARLGKTVVEEEPPVVWFVTTPGPYHSDGESAGPWTTHAKTVGTLVTACGANATSWHMLWQYRFPTRGLVSCQACLEVLIYRGRPRNPAAPRRPSPQVDPGHRAAPRDTATPRHSDN